jgi:hypothetical protein
MACTCEISYVAVCGVYEYKKTRDGKLQNELKNTQKVSNCVQMFCD